MPIVAGGGNYVRHKCCSQVNLYCHGACKFQKLVNKPPITNPWFTRSAQKSRGPQGGLTWCEDRTLPYPIDHSVGEHDKPQVPRAGFELASGLGCAHATCGVLATDADSDLARLHDVNERPPVDNHQKILSDGETPEGGGGGLLTKNRHAVKMLNMPTASPW